MSNVYYSPAELQIACDRMKHYTEFLLRQMNEYDRLMNSLTTDAVISEKVGASVAELREAIKPIALQINTLMSSYAYSTVSDTIGNVRDAGNEFRYPDETFFARVISLLSHFL